MAAAAAIVVDEEIVGTGVAGEAAMAKPPLIPSQHLQDQQDSEAPSIQTCPQEIGRGVDYITAGVEVLIFVQNLQHVHGKIYLRQSHRRIIERLTSSVQIQD